MDCEFTPAQRRQRNLALVILTAFHLALLGFGQLKFEEAYYWNYSQHPDLSYFDHPPAVAWLISASCSLLGSFCWSVKLPAALLYSCSCWLLSEITGRVYGGRAALLNLALLASIPALAIHSTMILPDSPLIFCWSLGLWGSLQLFETEDTRWWWLIGVATGLGLDSKYSALLIPLGAFLQAFWINKPGLALNLRMLMSAVLAIELFSPVILWNLGSDFASFKFQGGERMAQATSLKEKLGGWLFQFALFSPLAFLFIPSCLRRAWKSAQAGSNREKLLLCCTLPFLALMVYVSLRRLVQINWPLPGYLGLICILSGELSERSLRTQGWVIVQAGLLRCLLLALILFPIGLANAIDDINQWDEFGRKALEIRAQMPIPEKTFLAAPGYQSASELAFTTLKPHLTLSNNFMGQRALGYDYWEQPADFLGWDCVLANYAHPRSNPKADIRPTAHPSANPLVRPSASPTDGISLDPNVESALVWKERNPLDLSLVRPHFEKIEGPITVVVERGGRPLRRYQFFRCFGYRPHARLTPHS